MNLIEITCNNVDRFRIIVDNLPTNISNYKLLIVNDSRLGDKRKELTDIIESSEIKCDYEIVSTLEILDSYVSKHPNVYNLMLAIKIILPWYINKIYQPKKFIILDDDIVITEKIDELFEKQEVGAVRAFQSHTVYESKGIQPNLFKEMFIACGINFNEEVKRISGGHMMFSNKLDFEEYERISKRFFESDILTNAISKQKNWRSYYIDEVFFSCLYHIYSYKYNVYGMQKYVKLYANIYDENKDYTGFDIFIKRRAITHLAIRNKQLLYIKLIELGYLKYRGEKNDFNF